MIGIDTGIWVAIASIFPFSGLFSAIRRNKIDVYPFVFAIVYFFIGTQMIATDNNDFGRYMATFSSLAQSSDVSFWSYFHSMDKGNQIDVVMPFMTWLISRFTSNTHMYAGILAMFNGICLSFIFSYITKKAQDDSIYTTLLLFVLLFVPNIVMCTHRWWIAMQVFLLGALPFILDNKYSYITLSVFSVLIHFSFLYPLVLLLVYKIIPQRTLLPFIILFLVSNLIEELDILSIVNYFERFLPDSFNNRNEMYLNSELLYHNFLSQSARLVWKFLNIGLVIYIYLVLIDILEDNSGIRSLYVISLIIGSFAAIANLTEWGWRYLDVCNFLFCSLYILVLSETEISDDRFYKTIRFTFPFFIYIILYQIRGLLSIIGIKALLFGNIITTWFIEESSSVLSLIKLILSV